MDKAGAAPQGLVLHGRLLSTREGEYQGRDGVATVTYLASILVGDEVYKVEFRSAALRLNALGSLDRDTVVAVPVRVRAGTGKAAGMVFYRGSVAA